MNQKISGNEWSTCKNINEKCKFMSYVNKQNNNYVFSSSNESNEKKMQ